MAFIGLCFISIVGIYFIYLLFRTFIYKGASNYGLNIEKGHVLTLAVLETALFWFLYFTYELPNSAVAGGFLWENYIAYPRGIMPILFFQNIYDFTLHEKGIITIVPLVALMFDYTTLLFCSIIAKLIKASKK